MEYEYSEADDLYDMNILTKRKCPKCKERLISCPDCTSYCSNDKCDYETR